MRKPFKRRHHRRRGAVAAVVMMMLTTLAGLLAFSVDIGMMYNARADLQRTADASALAAAAMLGDYGTPTNPIDALAVARTEAQKYAGKNAVLGKILQLDTTSTSPDIVFGRASFNSTTQTYDFTPTEVLPDAVKVRVRFAQDSPNGPLPLFFARLYGQATTEIAAEAVAMMVPRDIAIAADLSGSTGYDSQLRHYDRDDIILNTFDVWAALPKGKGVAGILNGPDPAAPPAVPTAGDNQPATGSGNPGTIGGNPNPDAAPFGGLGPHGPRFGWMTGYGADLYPKSSYTPGTDVGLYNIPRYQTTTDPAVIANLTESGYSAAEIAAITDGSSDSSYSAYRNRVKVMLGLSGWRSAMSGGKYSGGPGNGNSTVDSTELYQTANYPFNQGSWDSFIDYVAKSSSPMNTSQANFRYYFGLKTFGDFVQVKTAANSQMPELADTPLQPLAAVKSAVDQMIDRLMNYQTNDQVALGVYATDGRIEVPLQDVYDPDTGTYNSAVADSMNGKQPAHYHIPVAYTNIEAGIQTCIDELQSVRARTNARKVILLLTDGMANYYNDSYGNAVGDHDPPDYPTAKNQAKVAAQRARDAGIQVFTVSFGAEADTALMEEIASIGGGFWMHAGGSVAEYTAALDNIFKTLGGLRPVALIQ